MTYRAYRLLGLAGEIRGRPANRGATKSAWGFSDDSPEDSGTSIHHQRDDVRETRTSRNRAMSLSFA